MRFYGKHSITVPLIIVLITMICVAQTDSRLSLTISSPNPGTSTYHLPVSNNYQELQRTRSPQNRNSSNAPPSPTRFAPLAKPLSNSTPVAQGLRSGGYVGSVGGVAFDQVAEISPKIRLRRVGLKYDGAAKDGDRLVVEINRQGYRGEKLYDWEIVPIAWFADSSDFAVVTLFGELVGMPNPPDQYVVGYHPAFENTLLGLRLFQGDFLLLDPNVTGELPKFNSQYVLGAGEEAPNPQLWQSSSRELNSMITGQTFVSYVISDYSQKVEINIDPVGEKLRLSGFPYFFFWRKGSPVTERMVDSSGRNIILQSFQVDPVSQPSDTISAQEQLLLAANPAVYRSLVKTMRYAAVFRYLKREAPDDWRVFLQDLQSISQKVYVAPTPVLLPKTH